MNQIKVLDCTLRDGGYCNNWEFGQKNIQKILNGLVDSGLDIIECGFFSDKIFFNPDVSKYNDFEQLRNLIPTNHDDTLFVIMINYGEVDFSSLPDCENTPIDGIRLAFHKKNSEAALEAGKIIIEKGYKLFLQPMVSLCYTDEEFLSLVYKANELKPYAFYIVDSFGEMKRRDLTRLFYLLENNLLEDILVGFHSHNNMQLAYSNAQKLIEMQTSRNLIVDSSVYGMGRGAGNLNTELFTEYLNEVRSTKYDIKPLLNIIDEVLSFFYQQKTWGYSLPNYLSALHSAHPNYAFYLDERKTLTIESMNEIFLRMESEKKYEYDKNYIENLYLQYMATGKTQEQHKSELEKLLQNKEVLLIGPGKSAEEEKEKICNFSKSNSIVVFSINYDYPYYDTNFVFISNMRRFKEFPKDKHNKCIITANIMSDDVYLQTKYKDLLNDIEIVKDNAVLMAVRFLINFGVKKIRLAGIDGYSHDFSANYVNSSMTMVTEIARLDAMNQGISTVLSNYKKEINISFLTTEKYIHIN